MKQKSKGKSAGAKKRPPPKKRASHRGPSPSADQPEGGNEISSTESIQAPTEEEIAHDRRTWIHDSDGALLRRKMGIKATVPADEQDRLTRWMRNKVRKASELPLNQSWGSYQEIGVADAALERKFTPFIIYMLDAG